MTPEELRAAIKVVENHLGRAYVKLAQQIMIQVPAAAPPPGQAPPAMIPAGAPMLVTP